MVAPSMAGDRKLKTRRYVIEEADIAFPWQSFYRIYDESAGEVVVESDDREKLERIIKSLNRE